MSKRYLCVGGWVKPDHYVKAIEVAQSYGVGLAESVLVDESGQAPDGVDRDLLLRLSPRMDADYDLGRRLEERLLKDALSQPQRIQLLPNVQVIPGYLPNLIDAAAAVVTSEFRQSPLFDEASAFLFKLFKEANGADVK